MGKLYNPRLNFHGHVMFYALCAVVLELGMACYWGVFK